MKINTSRKGFTLVELLVVIAIIAILSGIIITSLTASKAKSRDAARISDLNQIQLALEQYFNMCGQYPAQESGNGYSELFYPNLGVDNGCPSTNGTQITLGSFISVIPTDPLNGIQFGYVTNISPSSPPTDYILYTQLESPNSVQQNSFPDSVRSVNDKSWASSVSCYDPSIPANALDYCISTR